MDTSDRREPDETGREGDAGLTSVGALLKAAYVKSQGVRYLEIRGPAFTFATAIDPQILLTRAEMRERLIQDIGLQDDERDEILAPAEVGDILDLFFGPEPASG